MALGLSGSLIYLVIGIVLLIFGAKLWDTDRKLMSPGVTLSTIGVFQIIASGLKTLISIQLFHSPKRIFSVYPINHWDLLSNFILLGIGLLFIYRQFSQDSYLDRNIA